MEINKNNGISCELNDDAILKLSLINYFGNNIPSKTLVGSENKVNINTNNVINVDIDRDDTGNIISYADATKNKKHLIIPQITKRFNTDSLKYSLDFQFKEFFSQENIINSLLNQINELQSDIDLLLGNIKGKEDIINQLKQSDLDKQRQLEESQRVIDNLSKQAIEIANELAEEMKNASKTSTDALEKLTNDLSKKINDLKDDLEKEKENNKTVTKTALDIINDSKKQQSDKALKDGVSSKDTGVVDTINVDTFNDNLFSSNGKTITLTKPSDTEKEKVVSNKTSTNTIVIENDVKLFGTNVSAKLKDLENKLNSNKAATEPPKNKTEERGDSVLIKTNDLLVEIAIGQWYKYYGKAGNFGDTFERRDKNHLLRLKNIGKDSNGISIGAPVNNLTDSDITNLLKVFETYWKTIPYTEVYERGIPYSKSEQEEFEKIYPIFKGVTQYKTPPAHFLYKVFIFNDSSLRNNKYNYVKF